MNVAEWRVRFATLNPTPIDLTLDRMRKAAVRLGHPEQSLRPHIHISGTNGKGGVVAALETAFIDAGLKVQSYTSPFLWRFEENIRLSGQPIDSQLCEDLFAQLWELCADIPLTWFEAYTLVAFLAFAHWGADVTLIECGMGGASDATAIAPQPLAAVLTNVGGDHAEFLGHDLDQVALEKAGIAKGAPLYVPRGFAHDVGSVRMVETKGMHPSLALAGAILADFFPEVTCPQAPPPQNGRWTRDPNDPQVIYDVGHNAHAAAFLSDRLGQEPGPYLLRLGMLKRKDPRAFLAPFKPLNPYFDPVDLGEEGHDVQRLLDVAKDLRLQAWQGETVGTRLITGSHQTVSKLMPAEKR